jgi:Uma2 family endonuclease
MTVAIAPVTTDPIESVGRQPLLLNVRDVKLKVTPEHFDRLCIQNPDVQLELTEEGELIVLPPTETVV